MIRVGLKFLIGVVQTGFAVDSTRDPPLHDPTLYPEPCYPTHMIGIIGAMTEELELLLENLQNKQTTQHGPFTLHAGTLEGQEVLLAQCGIGKVNAAALTQLMILQKVDKIIFTGVAGAVDKSLKVGDIVISTDTMQHDSDVRALGYQLGEVPGETLTWQADEHLRTLAFDAARKIEGINVITGRVLSGDQFIASPEKVKELREVFEGACAEMEGAAVAQICSKWKIPFVIIRSMSDSADHDANVNFREFTKVAAARAKQVVRGVLQKIAKAEG